MEEYNLFKMQDKIFLIDGYPRNQDNINGFLEVFGDSYQIICTLYLSCDETTCIDRIKLRSQTSGRIDDSEEVIKKRFNTFYSESYPIMDELKKLCTIVEVPSTTDKNLVFQDICNKIEPLLNTQI
jgi:UMP-CMP kinase